MGLTVLIWGEQGRPQGAVLTSCPGNEPAMSLGLFLQKLRGCKPVTAASQEATLLHTNVQKEFLKI